MNEKYISEIFMYYNFKNSIELCPKKHKAQVIVVVTQSV